jgi:hypothetical protein
MAFGQLPFSIEDCGVYQYASGVPGTLADVAGIFRIDLRTNVTSANVRGDASVLATASSFDSVTVTEEIHAAAPASLAIVAGGTSTTVTGPPAINTLNRKSTDVVADYKLAGQTHTHDASGGGFRITLFRCQYTSGPDFNLADSAFPAYTVVATAVPDATFQMWQIDEYAAYTALV